MAGYTVVDVETTGLFPKAHDRIVEIAVVYVSELGRIEGEWSTLVNPGRDVGPTRIHGITARDVANAPSFADIAPYVLQSVAGRTIVAHNSRFDTGFLTSELERVGVPLQPYPLPSVCTMSWSSHFVEAQSRRLVDCCRACGVALSHAHSALGDARATAELLSFYISRSAWPMPWWMTLDEAAAYPWPSYTGQPPQVSLVTREHLAQRRPDGWLDGIVAQVPRAGDSAADSYLEMLGRALVDRYLSVHEQDQLVVLAAELGLGRNQLTELHVQFLNALGAAALADRVVTDAERQELESVAAVLGLGCDAVAQALSAESPCCGDPVWCLELCEGDRVVLTGEMRRPREEWTELIIAAGLECGGVTKRTKAVVAADPDSASGKAEKARAYGVPVVTEAAFAEAFDRYVAARG